MDNAKALETQQFGTVWRQCVARAWQDAQFRTALKADPAGTLLDAYQFSIPAGVELQVLESTEAQGAMKANALRMVIPPVPEMDMQEIALIGPETNGATALTCFC